MANSTPILLPSPKHRARAHSSRNSNPESGTSHINHIQPTTYAFMSAEMLSSSSPFDIDLTMTGKLGGRYGGRLVGLGVYFSSLRMLRILGTSSTSLNIRSKTMPTFLEKRSHSASLTRAAMRSWRTKTRHCSLRLQTTAALHTTTSLTKPTTTPLLSIEHKVPHHVAQIQHPRTTPSYQPSHLA